MKIRINGFITNQVINLVVEAENMTEEQAAQEGKNAGIFVASAYTEIINQAPSLIDIITKHLPTIKAATKMMKVVEKAIK